MSHHVKALVLCAGKGTRLQTEGIDLPKVMRQADGKPLLHYVLTALDFLPREDIILVVGYKKEYVLEAYGDYPHAVQAEQLGTGHAVKSAQELLEDFDGDVLVCCGDMPLMKKSTYEAIVAAHRAQGNVCTLLSGHADNLPYGRIIRDADGNFHHIIEEKDATEEERAITELNAGVYLFHTKPLFEALAHLRSDNAQGEYYLTDVPGWLLEQGYKVGVCDACDPVEMLGVNTVAQLEEAENILRGDA